MMLFWVAHLFYLFLSTSVTASSFIPLTDKNRPALSLVGGQEDIGDDFSSVVVFSKDDEKLSSRCSGTKIAKNMFLTAAHCFVWEENGKIVGWPENSDHSKKQLYFSFAPQITKNIKIDNAEVKNIYFHPAFARCLGEDKNLILACIDQAPDLAVVEVKNSPAFISAPTSPIDFFGVQVGEKVAIVGYGYEKEGDETSPKRKYHLSQVAAQDELRKVYLETPEEETTVDDDLYFGVFGNSLGDQYANLGSGDSGGPVFRSRNGLNYLVGVNSFTFCPKSNPDCEIATSSFFGRLHTGGKYFLGEWLSSVLAPKPS